MSTFSTPGEWCEFLKQYASALHSGEWQGNPAASEAQLVAVEGRLKVRLPPSYRTFLSASNGWRQASRAVPVLRAAESIRWFRREHREWVQAYVAPMQGIDPRLPAEQEYFKYGQEEGATWDVKHLAHTLCISDVGDSAVLLLNPMVVWPDGEWEAWFFANWFPGAMRYHSFADWMRHEFTHLRDEAFEHTRNPGELPTVYLDGPSKAKRRVRAREEILVLDEVLGRLKSKRRAQRVKATRQLCRLGGQEAIDALLSVLRNDSDDHVRCEAAEALGRLQAHESIGTLIALATEESYISGTAIQALGNFRDEQSAECLLKLVEEDGSSAGTAAYALARRKDSRGVAPLLQKLLSTDPRDQHTGSIAGRFIADFGRAGFLALEPLAAHSDMEIRERAVRGIEDIAFLSNDKDLKVRARELLEQCFARETDGKLHQWLAGTLEMMGLRKFGISENPFSES